MENKREIQTLNGVASTVKGGGEGLDRGLGFENLRLGFVRSD